MTLKTKNTPFLVGYIVILYVGFAFCNGLDWSFVSQMQIGKQGMLFANPIITLAFHFVVLVLSYLLPSSIKNQVIFLRSRNPLPGTRAFSSLIERDPRILRTELEAIYGQLLTSPDQQNALWYRIYKEKQKDPVVNHSHGKWLLFRDAFSVTLLILIPASVYTYVRSGLLVGICFLVAYLIIMVALWISARNTANRFVCNVLAR